jgi:methyl-CpG-binding domain protein 4
MIANDGLGLSNRSHLSPATATAGEAVAVAVSTSKTLKKPRQPRKHVSSYFSTSRTKRKSHSRLQSHEKQGMVAGDLGQLRDGLHDAPVLDTAEAGSEGSRPEIKQRRPRKNVSRHFKSTVSERKGRSQLRSQETQPTMTPPYTPLPAQTRRKGRANLPELAPQPPPEILVQPRIIHGVNIDEDLSSDSSLTSLPDSIGSDPFLSSLPSLPKLLAPKTKRPKVHQKKSPYFPHPHRPKSRPTFISSILPFPPLSAPRFGLMQERLAHNPFRLLIATIFLNKTPGARAMPVFYDLMAAYPTPEDLSRARVEDVVEIIRCLGFQNQRARKCVAMAKRWVEEEPRRGRRWAKRDYPRRGDGRGLHVDEWVGDGDDGGDGDERVVVAWEISHLPGLGAYAHDSWRMFCRDTLRGVAEGWNGEGAITTTTTTEQQTGEDDRETQLNGIEAEGLEHKLGPPSESHRQEEEQVPFEPEWKRVLPTDKELRAWMTWMWLKEGWVWNKETGERTPASEELMEKARGGGVVREEMESECLVVEGVGDEKGVDGLRREVLHAPAGAFMALSLRNGNGNGIGKEVADGDCVG